MPPRSKKSGPPPGNTGTHQPAPNKYVLSQISRVNYLTSRRTPFAESPDALATQLQRLVHFEGNRPPNRKILFHLRMLTYYPPVLDLLADLILLLDYLNPHICRLAHYHIRQLAPITDPELYRTLLDSLQRQAGHQSPARRVCATKTYAKVVCPPDAGPAIDFVSSVFNRIGGARVAPPMSASAQAAAKREQKKEKKTFREKATATLSAAVAQRKIVRGDVYEPSPAESADLMSTTPSSPPSNRSAVDDGAGGSITSAAGKGVYVRSRFGKMLLGHTALAALRRINRISVKSARLESYFFDSGLLSVVPSTVRHTIALLELRSGVSPGPVSRYLAARLPHKNPPPHLCLYLEDLGARVYYARLLSALAEDPDLSPYIPDDAPAQAKRHNQGAGNLKEAMAGTTTFGEKASNLFKFLFNNTKDHLNRAVDVVKATTSEVTDAIVAKPRLKRNDPLGVEFAEALVNLVKNPSNRVLMEALRGLSRRKWTTWFESPIPQGALYNSPELADSAFGDSSDAWGLEDDEDDNKVNDDDEDELGSFEGDVVGDEEEGSKGSLDNKDPLDPEGKDDSDENETWLTRVALRRKERRIQRVEKDTPLFLRQLGHGMVTALEVILRRLNAGLLEDEPIRRFSCADAIIVLARAKIYGHTEEDHQKFRRAQGHMQASRERASSRALILPRSGEGALSDVISGLAFREEKHPFEGLVKPLKEILDEDPNPFVRGRAAAALLFIIASGAGRGIPEVGESDIDVSEGTLKKMDKLRETPLLLRYFSRYVTEEQAGSGVGLRLMSELIDYLVYELLDFAPDLAPSAVELAERWAFRHPTVGVCGRLGALWEKVLSIGQGEVVGKSIFRAMEVAPNCERVAAAATIFLRRRTLDIAIITVGSVSGNVVPEPLPRAVGVEMEKYFSLLWHTALLGPSAECRKFAVESLGGAAALAGEPFRICTYERLVELVRMRGLGVKVVAECVLDCLDTLYFCRERFSEGRARNGIARDGSNRSRTWLELVWKLTAEASAAAQILLGVPPPTGWQPLGASAAADVTNAQSAFGDVRDREDVAKLKDESVALGGAATEIPLISGDDDVVDIPDAAGQSSKPAPTTKDDKVEDVTQRLDDAAFTTANNRNRSRSRSRSRSRERRRERSDYDDDREYDRRRDYDDEQYRDRYRDEWNGTYRHGDDGAYDDSDARDYRRDSRAGHEGSFSHRRSSARNAEGKQESGPMAALERARSAITPGLNSLRRSLRGRGTPKRGQDAQYWDEYGRRDAAEVQPEADSEQAGQSWIDDEDNNVRRSSNISRAQEEADLELARKLQDEELGVQQRDNREDRRRTSNAGNAVGGASGAAADALRSAGGAAERLIRQGVRGGKGLTEKVMKSAARSAAMDRLRSGGGK